MVASDWNCPACWNFSSSAFPARTAFALLATQKYKSLIKSVRTDRLTMVQTPDTATVLSKSKTIS